MNINKLFLKEFITGERNVSIEIACKEHDRIRLLSFVSEQFKGLTLDEMDELVEGLSEQEAESIYYELSLKIGREVIGK